MSAMSATSATSAADLLAIVLARELLAACERGLRVLAVTSLTSLVAGLAARRLGGGGLALATGFGVLDANDAFPALTLGELALGTRDTARGPSSDTFVALARGFLGVAVTPAQLDGTGATNLSRIGGTDERPGVALPGARGLPENNDAPGPLWYVFPRHSPRHLVERVHTVCGPPPSPGRYRRLLTPLGLFALDGGWSALALAPGVTPEQVDEGTGFAVDLIGHGTLEPPSDQERSALRHADPDGLRRLELLPPDEAAALVEAVREREAGPSRGGR